MDLRSRPAPAVALASSLVALFAPALLAVPASAAPAVDPAVDYGLSGARSGAPALAVTEGGATLAVWLRSTERRGARLQTAVRGEWSERWGQRTTLDSWRPPGRHAGSTGDPQVAAGPGGDLVAVWVDGRFRLVSATWSADDGWSEPERVGSGRSSVSPSLVANEAGELALSWQRVRPDGTVELVLAVDRGTGWQVQQVGSLGRAGWGRPAAPVGIDEAGNVSVAWRQERRQGTETFASRLASGATTWEEPTSLGRASGSCACWPGLLVTPEGTAYLSDTAAPEGEQDHVVRFRDGAGPWEADDRIPFLADRQRFLLDADGALMTWDATSVHTRQEDGSWDEEALYTGGTRLDLVVADRAGGVVALDIRRHTIWVRHRTSCGSWAGAADLARRSGQVFDDAWRARRMVAATTPAGDNGMVLWRARDEGAARGAWGLRATRLGSQSPLCKG